MQDKAFCKTKRSREGPFNLEMPAMNISGMVKDYISSSVLTFIMKGVLAG